VLHIAVTPGVEVLATATAGEPTVQVQLANYSDAYEYVRGCEPRRHRLIEAAIAEDAPSASQALSIAIRSEMPPGASTGTSAAVLVGIVAALGGLRGEIVAPSELARAAHRIETVRLGLQAGVQDHVAAAFGGINYVTIDAYPEHRVTPVAVTRDLEVRLSRQLVLIYLGRAHRSSTVHEEVIAGLENGGDGEIALESLRAAASAARDALTRGDLAGFGDALRRNTAAQARLHPGLVGADAHRIGEAADAVGALGWKVNGAGGEGGSVSVLLRNDTTRDALMERIRSTVPAARHIPIRLAGQGAMVR
jgi:D-glycero-alpha-D-manno-heptose-7-phosphate kinase